MTAITRIQDFDDPTYDPFLSDELTFGSHADPYPRLAQLREQASVHETSYRCLMGLADALKPDRKYFTVLGYDAVNTVLTSPEVYGNGAYVFNLGISFGRSISTMDAPEHVRYRRIFQGAFAPAVVAQWGESVVAPVIDGLIARFESTGTADLVADFAIRYPFEVIYRQLDMPQHDIATFQRLAIAQTDFSQPEKAVEAGRKLGVYFAGMMAARRQAPRDDLITRLVETEIEGEKLPDEILIAFLRQLMNAAGDTTYRGTCVLLTALLENPDQFEAVRADRSLIAPTIDEALRWDGPVLAQSRMALQDTVLAGVTIPKGSMVDVVAGSANRDPSRYPDPDRFNILRPKGPTYMAFSRGPHICIGQHLARIEMTRALSAVLDRLPGLRLDPDKPRPQLRGAMMRVPQHIHVRFDA